MTSSEGCGCCEAGEEGLNGDRPGHSPLNARDGRGGWTGSLGQLRRRPYEGKDGCGRLRPRLNILAEHFFHGRVSSRALLAPTRGYRLLRATRPGGTTARRG